jgi:pyruvate/2-oxoglutarate dehydrogenase complex dihydrolipoamide acyltransferase (E2) component
MTTVVFPTVDPDNADAEGVVSTWYATDGSAVTAGQLIAEVAVDKASMDVEAPVAGTLRVAVDEGEIAQQGAPIATIT